MSSQPNRLKPNTTAFTMLRRGWELSSPEGAFFIKVDISVIRVFRDISIGDAHDEIWIADYPLTADGFEQMMNEVVNPPF